MKYTNVKPPLATVTKQQILKPFEAFKAVYNQEISKQKQLLASKDMYAPDYIRKELALIKQTIAENYTQAAEEAQNIFDSAIEAAKTNNKPQAAPVPASMEEKILQQLTMLNTRQELQDQFGQAADAESFAQIVDQYHQDPFAMNLINRELQNRSVSSEQMATKLQYESIKRELSAVSVPSDVRNLVDGINREKAFKSYKMPSESGEFQPLDIEYTGVQDR